MEQMYRIFYLNHSFALSPDGGKEFDVIFNSFDNDWAEMLMKALDHKELPVRIGFGSLSAWDEFKDNFKQVDAAGGVVMNKKGEILFIKRLGLWDLPKGKIEKKESLEECAIREVEEECNISGLKIIKPLAPTYHIYFRKTWKIKMSQWYLMESSDYKNAKPQKKEGITDVEWFGPEKYKNQRLSTYPAIREVLRLL